MTDPITSWSTLALAVFSFIAVGISYWGIKKQAESLASSVSADLCLKMVDRFDSPAMLMIRSLAARALLDDFQLVLADDVFDFFELLGLYVRRDMLDAEIVHSMFFHWINLYWNAGKAYIVKSRERSNDIYVDFQDVYKAVLAIEMKTAPNSRDINPTQADVEEFLKQELASA
jgi:hypothetical protein